MAFPTDWGKKLRISVDAANIDAGADGGTFALVITHATIGELSSGDQDLFWNNVLSDGGDLRVSSDSAGLTRLPLEVFHINTTNKTLVLWTRRTGVDDTVDTDLYLWWDKAGESQPAVTDTYGRNAVFADYSFFTHDLVTDSTGSYTAAFDVTGNPAQIDGPFGNPNGAYDFDGSGDWIDVDLASGPADANPISGLGTGDPITVGAWLGNDSTNSFNRALHVRGGGGPSIQLVQNWDSSRYGFIPALIGVSAGPSKFGGALVSDGVYQKIVGIEPSLANSPDANTDTLFNATVGGGAASGTGAGAGASANDIRFGARNDSAGPFFGKIAEVWIRRDALSTDHYVAESRNQNNPDTFFDLGVVDNLSDSGTNVTTNTETLTLTELQASVALDVNVDTSTETLILTEYQASITSGFNVQAGTETLTLTENQASITLDVNINAGLDSLALSTYTATVETGSNTVVNTNPDTLVLTELQANISYDVEVLASPGTLILTEYQATVQLGVDTNVNTITESLTLTELQASISYVVLDTKVSFYGGTQTPAQDDDSGLGFWNNHTNESGSGSGFWN